MDSAEELILEQGFAGTSVDAILERVDLTKGAFFHHFPSKSALARALVERFAEADAALLERTMERAERLSRDPAQQLLIFVGLLEEQATELTAPHPGCLFASYCYEAQLFDEVIHGIIRTSFVQWRERLGSKVTEAIERHPPAVEVDADDLADMLNVVTEGAFVLTKALNDAGLVARQLRQFRNYLELLLDVSTG